MTVVIDVRGLDEARARLFDRSSRVVGWGTGSVFDYFHERFPIRLDYLVDNDSARWGQGSRGLEVSSPARLPGKMQQRLASSSTRRPGPRSAIL